MCVLSEMETEIEAAHSFGVISISTTFPIQFHWFLVVHRVYDIIIVQFLLFACVISLYCHAFYCTNYVSGRCNRCKMCKIVVVVAK